MHARESVFAHAQKNRLEGGQVKFMQLLLKSDLAGM